MKWKNFILLVLYLCVLLLSVGCSTLKVSKTKTITVKEIQIDTVIKTVIIHDTIPKIYIESKTLHDTIFIENKLVSAKSYINTNNKIVLDVKFKNEPVNIPIKIKQKTTENKKEVQKEKNNYNFLIAIFSLIGVISIYEYITKIRKK